MGFDDEISRMGNDLERKQRNVDEIMNVSRELIRDCAKAITLLHNKKTTEAVGYIKEARRLSKRLGEIDNEFRNVSAQAYQELAEAEILYGIKTSKKIPLPKDIGIESGAYLLGLMDTVGELKRSMLIALHDGRISDGELYLSLIERIYDATRGLRFSESILPSFRRKQDTARIQLENAGSDMLKFTGLRKRGR